MTEPDQIIWFFDKPTIFACPVCERVADYYKEQKCKKCGRDMVEFTAKFCELQASLDSK